MLIGREILPLDLWDVSAFRRSPQGFKTESLKSTETTTFYITFRRVLTLFRSEVNVAVLKMATCLQSRRYRSLEAGRIVGLSKALRMQ